MRIAAVFLSVLLLPSLCLGAEPRCLRIASIAEAPDVDFGSALGEALYHEAGLCATMIRLPTERVKRMLEAGELDGVTLRAREFMQVQTGMVVAPTPLLTVEGRLYWLAGRPKPEGAGSRVGFPRGWVWPRRVVEAFGLVPEEVGDSRALLKMTESGRLDGFIMVTSEFNHFAPSGAERAQFTSVPVQTVPLYHAVTEAHADLVPKLDAAIKRMVARGDVMRLLGLQPSL